MLYSHENERFRLRRYRYLLLPGGQFFERLPAHDRAGDAVVRKDHGGTQRAVMERFCEPRCAYFDLRPPFGGGWALQYDAGLWAREKRLRVIREVCYAREGTKC